MKDRLKTLKKEQIEVLYTNNKQGWIGSLLLWLGILFAYGFPDILASYLLTVTVVIATILHIITSQQFSLDNIKTPAYWEMRTMIISGMQGSLLGITPWFMLSLSEPSKVYLITALLVLPMYGSAVVSGTSKKLHLTWCLTSVLPITAYLLLSGQREYQIMAVMLLITGIPSSILMNVYFYNLFSKTILLKYENEDLLDEVQQQKHIAEKESSEKSRFIAATSHDLRQPLYALNLYLDVLEQKLNNTEQKDLLKKAMLSSQSLNDLLNSLMDVSRLDAGVVQAVYKKCFINKVIFGVVQDIQPLAKRRDIVLEYTQDKDLSVLTDAVLLARILRNLILNAVRHNQHCQVSVGIEENADSIEIIVKDTGKGIEKSEQKNIFSEFYQIDNPERDRNKGLGLGLPIVSRLCKLMSIDLQFKSTLNQGTCFQLNLVKDAEISEWSTPIEIESNDEPSGLFVVLIDDDEVICDAIRALLRNWNCEVLVALSQDDLFEELNKENYPCPDVIISDYRLAKNCNGGELIEALRLHFNTIIEAIIISGEIKPNHSLEHCEWMLKPVGANTLKKKLVHLQNSMSP